MRAPVESGTGRAGAQPSPEKGILYRQAGSGDIDAVAKLLCQAGGEALQFILDELAPDMSALALYRYMVAQEADQYSYRRCLVAQAGCEIVALVNAFPAEILQGHVGYEMSPREAHVMGSTPQLDLSSYIINNIAVAESHRQCGIGARLIESVAATAYALGFAHLQLQVWADNYPARALYAKSGFVDIGHTDVPWHPALPHEGGRITMQRRLSGSEEAAATGDAEGLALP